MRRRNLKWRRILGVLAQGHRLTRFEAAKIGDTCLNSTVCDIQDHGVPVARRAVSVPGYGGSRVRCNEYWLDKDGLAQARLVLDGDCSR